MTGHPTIGGGAAFLGRSLRRWRAIRRCKQTHAAELLNVSQATVSRWENGSRTPDPDERAAITRLLAARLDAPADRQLARLVERSTLPLHLVCDLTHALLACSAPRARQFHRDVGEVIGTSLWPCASEEIVRAEARLPAIGWYDAPGLVVEAETGARPGPVIDIAASRFRWTRLQLSDGSFARLVETVCTA